VAYFAASTDDAETNRRFAESLGADYPILADPTKEAARRYGVLMAIGLASRVTFYVGIDGRIVHVDRDVDTSTAGTDVAKRFAELGVPRRPAPK
jgi:peroxiredoxin Q/BCP